MDKASLWGLEADWGAIATVVAGAMAVGAAWWTVWETKKAARAEALERRQAAAARAIAILEVVRAHIKEWAEGGYGPLDYAIPWSAFTSMSSDIGLIGISGARMFYFIESLARDLEAAYGKGECADSRKAVTHMPGQPDRKTIDVLLATIRKLRRLCFRILPQDQLNSKEKEYAWQPLDAPDPE